MLEEINTNFKMLWRNVKRTFPTTLAATFALRVSRDLEYARPARRKKLAIPPNSL